MADQTSQHDHDRHAAHARLIARLRQQADEVRRMTSGLDERALATRTVAGKWSLKELAAHLARVQQVFGRRIEAMLEHDNPAVAGYEPEGDREFDSLVARPAAEVLQAFFSGRDWLIQRLDGLSAAQWHRTGRHPEFERYDVHFQVEYMIHHEAHHLYQMFERRAPLGKMPH
ncbi:MAG TPA: DinB family protein [Vicinamibacterales bacterium]|nr:DinB family protein [Vicinamibacterales bacterium]